MLVAERREGIGTLDDPTKGEERDASENGGAPGAGVPPAVLFDSEPPLLSERCGVRIRGVRGVRVSDLVTREVGAVAGNSIRRRGRRGRVFGRIGVLVLISHSGCSVFSWWAAASDSRYSKLESCTRCCFVEGESVGSLAPLASYSRGRVNGATCSVG